MHTYRFDEALAQCELWIMRRKRSFKWLDFKCLIRGGHYDENTQRCSDVGFHHNSCDRRRTCIRRVRDFGLRGKRIIGACTVVIAVIVSSAIQVADQWDRAVILRLGHFHSLKGPGLFFIIPVIDAIPYWIDTRVITTGFKAEKTLTKDTVPVDVDAVLFWKVVDPKKAALDVADYQSAISWASQTALRDVIGKTMLSDMLEGRDKISSDAAEDH